MADEPCLIFAHPEEVILFLDEIGELPFTLQPKLLRALEQREIKRVGGNETILSDVRILAATHRNLREEIPAGEDTDSALIQTRSCPLGYGDGNPDGLRGLRFKIEVCYL
jgi:sigma54-dependent transcription regulator